MDLPRPLARTLGLPSVLFLTLSISTPASSVFVILPGMVGAAGSGALLALLIAILICLATGVVYAELASAWPVAGGEYVFVAHTLGPAAGFAMLVVNLFNTLLFPPVVALGIAAVASSFMPGLPVVPVAIAVLAAATLVALLNIRVNAIVTGLFLAVELIALVVVAILGFGNWERPILPMLTDPVMPAAASTAIATGTAGRLGRMLLATAAMPSATTGGKSKVLNRLTTSIAKPAAGPRVCATKTYSPPATGQAEASSA